MVKKPTNSEGEIITEKNKPEGDKKTQTNDQEGKLTDEQWKTAFAHPRFKELTDAKAKLEEIESNQSEAEEKKLKEDKKFEELATKREGELGEANASLVKIKIQVAVERAAVKAGITDTEAAYKLIDQASIKVDKDGTVQGVEDAMKALAESKPYLVGKEGSPASTIGAGTNPDVSEKNLVPLSVVREKYKDVPWLRAKHEEHGGKTGAEYLQSLQDEGRIDPKT